MASIFKTKMQCNKLLCKTRLLLNKQLRNYTLLSSIYPKSVANCDFKSHTPQRNKMGKVRGNLGLAFPDRKMGREIELSEDKPSFLEHVSDTLEIAKKGIPELKDEWYRKCNFDTDVLLKHKDYEYIAKFDEETVKTWHCTGDSEVEEGKSSAQFTTSPAGKALFHGFLNIDVPKDGSTKKAGFCNISSPHKKKSFDRQIPYDWSGFTDLCLRVRGDGRNYMVLLQMDNYYSHHWHDMYNFPLFTRGGPYWQFVKIPFSKFFLSSGGRIQDNQHRLDLKRIRDVGITLADGVTGPFQLEIDYIGIMYDANFTDIEFEYELYRKDRFTV